MEVSLKILFESLLNEGRAKSIIDKWSNYVVPGYEDRGPLKNEDDWDYVIKTVQERDPSGTGKYLDYALSQIVSTWADDLNSEYDDIPSIDSPTTFILNLVDSFHKFSERNLIQNKDIYSPEYKDITVLRNAINQATNKHIEITKEKELKGAADKIYQDSRWVVMVPKTHEASCHYGAGTKWCTTAKGQPSYFTQYTSNNGGNGILFYILDKTRKEGVLYKLAIHRTFNPGREVCENTAGTDTGVPNIRYCYTPLLPSRGLGTGYDELDSQVNLSYIMPLLPKELGEAIDNYYEIALERFNNKKKSEAIEKIVNEKNNQKTSEERFEELQKVFVPYLIEEYGFYDLFDEILSDANVINPEIRNTYGRWSYMMYQEGRFQIYKDTSWSGGMEEDGGDEDYGYFIEGKIFPNENTFFSCRLYKTKEGGGSGVVEDADPVSDLIEVSIRYLFSRYPLNRFTTRFTHLVNTESRVGINRLSELTNWSARGLIRRISSVNDGDEISTLMEFLLDRFTEIFEKNAFNMLFKNNVPTKDGSILWRPVSTHSSYRFEYPASENSLTKRFLDYLIANPTGKNPEEFYQEILGRPRPPAHNSTFFSSIKDAGLVRSERRGRKFVYFIGPNYEAWTQGRVKRV